MPGTIKNIDLVQLGLQRIPQLLADYDWVFIGSPGWLIAFDDRISQYGLDAHFAAVEAMYFVCSYSSGIPEAGGDAAFYFDPTSLPSFEQTLLAALRRLRFERAAIRAASRRQALRFTCHDFACRIDEAIARTAQDIDRC